MQRRRSVAVLTDIHTVSYACCSYGDYKLVYFLSINYLITGTSKAILTERTGNPGISRPAPVVSAYAFLLFEDLEKEL